MRLALGLGIAGYAYYQSPTVAAEVGAALGLEAEVAVLEATDMRDGRADDEASPAVCRVHRAEVRSCLVCQGAR